MAEISYVFHLPDGDSQTITLRFADDSFLLQRDDDGAAKDWTALGFKQCPHCPLTPDTSPHCPLARALSGFVHGFDAFYSYEMAVVEVVTAQRTMTTTHPLQDSMASILGLVGATSGCPHLDFFRPMARFHLPFATEQETLLRVFSLHLLREYLRSGGQGDKCIGLGGLPALYDAVAKVNLAMAERIRAAFKKDVVVNAIVILDTFAQAVPWVMEDALRELMPLFDLGFTDEPEPVP